MARAHSLVIGGTGMLRAVSLALAAEGDVVSVVARSRRRLQRLVDEAARTGRVVHPIPLDYRDDDALRDVLGDAIRSHGPVRRAVVWIHSTAPRGPLSVAETVAGGPGPCAYFHVLGSAAADPSAPDSERSATFAALEGVNYHEVILGFVRGRLRSRWLTDAEIAAGVLEAVASGRARTVVGVVEPWSDRP